MAMCLIYKNRGGVLIKTQTTLQEILALNGMIEKIPGIFNQAKNALASDNFSKYETDIIRGAVALEKAALKARSIANVSFKQINMPLSTNTFMQSIVQDAHDISIEMQENNTMKIIMPCTLPHYRDSYKTMVTEPLRIALKDFCKSHQIPEYDSVVIVVVNYILDGACKNGVRDNDNYDYKQIINTIAYMTLPDDNYHCATMMNGTKIGNRDCTEIYVVPRKNFGEWYAKNGADLYS